MFVATTMHVFRKLVILQTVFNMSIVPSYSISAFFTLISLPSTTLLQQFGNTPLAHATSVTEVRPISALSLCGKGTTSILKVQRPS